ncbi:MAG: RrF2 family transcriptional regulator [Actinomycetales bacterium]
MKLSEGVEWGLHILLTLAWLGDQEPVPAAKLAASHDLPAAYLNKHLQALSRAGLLTSQPGPRGGFTLARPPEQISLLDVAEAIDGSQGAFRCSEIRRRGMGESLPARCFEGPCAINAVMQSADAAWREVLARHSIADIRGTVDEHAPEAAGVARRLFDRDPGSASRSRSR